MSNRTRKPDAELRTFASQLVSTVGIAEAARRMQLSRLTVLSICTGGDMYGATLEKADARRRALMLRAAV